MLKRKIIGMVLILALLLSLAAFATEAAVRIDTNAKGSLTLTYGYDGQMFEGLNICIYKVAEISDTAKFTLSGEFKGLPVRLDNIKTQNEWKDCAVTLSGYVVSEDISPDFKALTNEKGVATFNDIPLGLYLVYMVRAEQQDGYCHFDSFMISVPTLDEGDNWIYTVMARPKSFNKIIVPKEISYTINKLWKDEGNEHLRPQTVAINLYKDGEFAKTAILSAENNWSYTWNADDDGAIWQAVEINITNGYTVTIDQTENHFSVVNSYDAPPSPPATGDINNSHLHLILMCVAGLGLIVLGVTGKRGKKA